MLQVLGNMKLLEADRESWWHAVGRSMAGLPLVRATEVRKNKFKVTDEKTKARQGTANPRICTVKNPGSRAVDASLCLGEMHSMKTVKLVC